MKGVFELKGQLLDKQYEVKSFVGLAAILDTCNSLNLSFRELIGNIAKVNEDVEKGIEAVCELIYNGYLIYSELNDSIPDVSKKKMQLLLLGEGMATHFEEFTKVLSEVLPDVDPNPDAKKK